MSDTLETYAKELGECLNKRDYTLLDDFVKNHEKIYGKSFVMMWELASDEVKRLSYQKMVMQRIDMDKETIEYARKLI